MRAAAGIDSEVEIAKLVGALAVSFPHTQISSETIKVYISMLRDIPLEILTVAVGQAIADCEFFPTVRALREIAFNLTSELSTRPTAGEAWGILFKEIRHTGSYKLPHFDDPIIARVVQMMGWRELCLSETQMADRAHFMKIYDTLLNREINEAKLLPAARALRHSSTHALPAGADDRLLAEEASVH